MGDGINDASAIHAADVGISVDGAVDVPKDAADSAFIADIVIGMADGLTVQFALAAGLSGAVQSNSISALLTIICLFFSDILKVRLSGNRAFKGALKVAIIGITAATAAFLVAKLFNNLF